MNYIEYMEHVKVRLNQLTEQEKTEWIQQIARKKTANEWADFLDSLQNQALKSNFHEAEFVIWCEKVTTGNYAYNKIENEFYYNDYEGEDFYYYDDDDQINTSFLSYYQEACRQLNQKAYQTAFTIFKKLYHLTFTIHDLEGGMEKINLIDALISEILPVSEEEFIYPFLYTILQTSAGKNRLETLYRIPYVFSLEKIFSSGPEELLSIDFFLKEWIHFLQEQKDDDRSTTLLIEAAFLFNGLDEIKKIALEGSGNHPGLYLYLIEQLLGQENYQEVEKFGLLGLEIMKNKSKIRGEIAHLTALGAKELQHKEIYQYCQLEAFEIEPTFSSFFPLIGLLVDESLKKRLICQIKSQSEEKMTIEKKRILLFFLGDYHSLITRKERKNRPYFFSDNRTDIALLLFLLNQSKTNSLAMKTLFNNLYFNLSERRIEREQFIEMLQQWKLQQEIIEGRSLLISQVQKEIEHVAEEIVGGGFRKEYQKIAIFVQLLDEIKVSSNMAEKNEVLFSYKQKYKSKRAFQQELAEFA